MEWLYTKTDEWKVDRRMFGMQEPAARLFWYPMIYFFWGGACTENWPRDLMLIRKQMSFMYVHVKSSKKVEKNPVGVYGVIYSRLVSTKNGMSAKQNAWDERLEFRCDLVKHNETTWNGLNSEWFGGGSRFASDIDKEWINKNNGDERNESRNNTNYQWKVVDDKFIVVIC